MIESQEKGRWNVSNGNGKDLCAPKAGDRLPLSLPEKESLRLLRMEIGILDDRRTEAVRKLDAIEASIAERLGVSPEMGLVLYLGEADSTGLALVEGSVAAGDVSAPRSNLDDYRARSLLTPRAPQRRSDDESDSERRARNAARQRERRAKMRADKNASEPDPKALVDSGPAKIKG